MALLALALATGCVTRTLAITSEPSGAIVILDGRLVGRTPLEQPFSWYGTREVFLYREGPEPEAVAVDPALDPRGWRASGTIELRRPRHQLPGVEIVSDLLYPGKIEDRQEFHFQLERPGTTGDEDAATAEAEALLERAGVFRARALDGVPTPPPSD